MTTLAIVTGGSSGIGRATLAAAPKGARLVDISRSGPGRDDVHHIQADLADPSAWPKVGEAIATEVGADAWERIVLIHNAGTLDPIGFAGEVDSDDYARNVLLNSAAGQVLGQWFLDAVRDRGIPAELVLLSSGAARKPYPGWSAYCAGKAALEHWVRTVGHEQTLRGGARVLAVAPGVVATDMQARIRDSSPSDFPAVERFRRLHSDKELNDPDEVAAALWRLLESRPETGSVVDLRDV